MSRSSSDRIKPQASSHCPSAGSSNAPSLGSAAADAWPRTGNASTTRRSPSSASPPSASCCENYAIPNDVLGQTLRTARRGEQKVQAAAKRSAARKFYPVCEQDQIPARRDLRLALGKVVVPYRVEVGG